MQEQITSEILMIRPVSFTFNSQTADSNAFMNDIELADRLIQKKALEEFDDFVALLRLNDINVNIFQDTAEPHKPDSIFPNNWVSFHHSGKVVLYPMEAENRRLERRKDIIEAIGEKYQITEIIDLSKFEDSGDFLEGTGSIILDRNKKIAYASLSTRTSKKVLEAWKKEMPNYELVTFTSSDKEGVPIYHTNVMMCIGSDFAVVCLEAIKDDEEKLRVQRSLENSGKMLIPISLNQVYSFAGNMLLIKNRKGVKYLCMSQNAYNSLEPEQINRLSEHTNIIYSDIATIEKVAGGSIRCMMAEIHLPVK
ncbi:hypothetical protein SAMN06298216_4487 [Spirosomataceae bacterium TFI 002]|nr:hypothetical protein SAMN06298216_4487 [Spirosomataceae bacterium TFI 002]